MKNQKIIIIIFSTVILLVVLIAWVVGINKPFVDINHYNDAAFANMGRNYLKLGFWETKLGPVWEVNPKQPKPYFYYLHHPPLVALLTGVSFSIFGVHEWSARIIPILFSLGSLILIYLITKKLYDRKRAVVSLFFAAIMPLFFIFGKMVCHEAPTLFFSLLMLYFYLMFLDNEKYFKWIIFGQVFGLLSGWPIFYMSGLIFIHYNFFIRKMGFRLKKILVDKFFILLASPILFFVSWLIYAKLLTGSYGGISGVHSGKVAYEGLFKSFLQATGFIHMWSADFVNGFILKIFSYFLVYTTLPLAFLSSYYCVSASKNEDKKSRAVLLGLFCFGLIHIVLFSSGGVMNHPFWIYYFIPAIAISSAIVFNNIKTKGAKCATLVLFLVFSFSTIRNKRAESVKANDLFRYNIGKKINFVSEPSDIFGIRWPYLGTAVEFYADRYIEWEISDPDKYDYLILFTTEISQMDKNIFRDKDLIDIGEGFYLLNQKNKMSYPQYLTDVNFDNQIKFKGYKLDRFENYFFVSYFWEIINQPKENYKIFVHFEDKQGQSLFGQDHFLKNGLLDMKQLINGDKIVESYFIEIPPEYRDREFDIYIGVYSSDTFARLDIINIKTSDNRFRLP